MSTNNMKITKSHEWVILDGEVAIVGITNHAQELLGDLVFIELPKIGKHLKSGDNAGVVESVKAASDIYSPISGEVIAINEEVATDPTIVNTEAHTRGWLFKLKPSNLSELDGLMNNEEYLATI